MSKKRSFLFLQGVCSPFFARLGARLAADGHDVFKINFNGGDVAYWPKRRAILFRGPLTGLPAFLDEQYRRLGITDQVLFGDRRPIHRPAVEMGAGRGVRTHVFEEGYFRPYWVTLEREGVNRHSLLPRDPAWFWENGGRFGVSDYEPFHSPFCFRAAHDVMYHAASSVNPLLFPGYRIHAPVNAAIEYASYIRRFSLLRLRRRADDAVVNSLIGRSERFYLLPLQLDGDAQIRDHSRFEGMKDVLGVVMESFSRYAPPDSRLVIKNHPLDNGLIAYERIVADLCAKFGQAGRVDYLETGDLENLVRHAQGVVTVNSTVGAMALGLNCPTIALGPSIYNLSGLTFQGMLDDFWRLRPGPDAELFRRFRNAVIHTTQVNGGFYCGRGIALAVKNSRRRLTVNRSALEELL